jgi:hypothetical protein
MDGRTDRSRVTPKEEEATPVEDVVLAILGIVLFGAMFVAFHIATHTDGGIDKDTAIILQQNATIMNQ